MPFNHYAKIKRILESEPEGWVIRRIGEPTKAKNFRGEAVNFTHYYRIYGAEGKPLKYCKFQQIELLARILDASVAELPLID